MSQLSILTALVRGGLTPIAACAMGGNMMCESNMTANIAQRGKTTLTDAEYTAAADSGAIDFAHDAVGYGLCQWTYFTRKQRLLEYARSVGASVGDETMQVQFCLNELRTGYPRLWAYLQTTQDIHCAGDICTDYERPAVNNIRDRIAYANALYMQYGDILTGKDTAQPPDALSPEAEADTAETAAPTLPTVRDTDHTPEAEYLAALLESIGYDVLWDGLHVCLVDYQVKCGIDPDGICGEKTWNKLLRGSETKK